MTVTAIEERFHGFAVPSGMATGDAHFAKNKSGTGTITGLRIFKAGTFKDSMGYQRTWLEEHLEQMVFNFDLLRSKGILPHVPVREGHPGIFGSGGTVVGYFLNLRVEKADETSFLVSDLEITEPDAVGKWERGTYRGRSLEVGMYEDNNETTYWPTVMGVAFVDIPAVEGLYSRAQQNSPDQKSKFHFSQTLMDDDKETTPMAGENQNGGGQTPPTPPAGDGQGQQQQPPAPTPPAPEPTPPAPAPAPAPGGEHSNQGTAQHFTINGVQTADFAAVQAHINTLEGFRKETTEQARKDFVTSLATDKKIAAGQVESLQELALTYSDAQFDAFKASYAAAPTMSLLSNHAGSGGTPTDPGAGNSSTSKDDEVSILTEQIAMHKRAGMSQDKIEKLPSYKRLQALQSQSA